MPTEMSETDITTREGQVVYTMEPYIADELARVLQREADRGDKVDKGWEEDAVALGDAVARIEAGIEEDADVV